MVTLHCRVDRKNNNTPVLSNKEIDEFAHRILQDYKPELLERPGKIRYEHFLETYLGATIMYADIYNDDPDRPIWGATAFKDEVLKVFDKENMCVRTVHVPARTVIIDRSLLADGEGGRALFTALHEAGHLLLHICVYNPDIEGQISFLEDEMVLVVCCRQDTIERFYPPNPLRGRTRTSAEWREHQANYFAAAIAMPNATFRPFVVNLLHQHEFRKGQIVTGRDEDLDILAEDILPSEISETYGVSRQAAFIKLKKAGFVIDTKTFAERELQYTF